MVGSLQPMTTSRDRLSSLIRHTECDLAEAALLCCTEIDPELDVAGELLRLDAMADALRTSRSADDDDVSALTNYLAEEVGFTGYDQRQPAHGLLTHVLDGRQGLPIALSIVYIAVARRARIAAFGIALPGHFVVGVGAGERPIVIDPFHGGRRLDEADMASLVRDMTNGQLEFRRSMLRPASPPSIIRRLLNNLTTDFVRSGDHENALWTVELKLLLPNSTTDDHRAHGELLLQTGQFLTAATAFERYLELAGDHVVDAQEIRRKAISARAMLN